MPASIFVLAGVNGAGKSSIGGAALLARNVHYLIRIWPPGRCWTQIRAWGLSKQTQMRGRWGGKGWKKRCKRV